MAKLLGIPFNTACISLSRGQMTGKSIWKIMTIMRISCSEINSEGWQEAKLSSNYLQNYLKSKNLICLSQWSLVSVKQMKETGCLDCLFSPIAPRPQIIPQLLFFCNFVISHSNVVNFFQSIPPLNLSPLPSPHFPFFHLCVWLSSQLSDPSQQQLGQHWRELGPRRATPLVLVLCLLVFLFALVYVNVCGWPHACIRARLALSARSGFNWLMGTLLTLTVSVIQTQSRSHRLQQVSPLSIKANPLSPVRWRWGND